MCALGLESMRMGGATAPRIRSDRSWQGDGCLSCLRSTPNGGASQPSPWMFQLSGLIDTR